MTGDRAPVEHQPTEHAETATMDEQRADLAERWKTISSGAAAPSGGGLWGLPELPDGEVWVDMAGASVIACLSPSTIRSYLTTGKPKRNPFPPARRYLYRLFWPLSEIRDWRAAEDGQAAETR
ncbi:hypothetical protein [Amycolatopsis keratiniphila]|uniref:Uncharacterized protein n=1 Tax=Amycolatopsis keratiniphila subsp. keratiniphila TaxID=227715 RepID=A0A1W2M232_9PSEU|nr:hypothetical protein [Amycolatopsis keratiniphila]ONF73962.1 hypothetical protein AVR91_0204325 [Amycolatopsis keratiniphila subsp. keratiniphila]